MLSLSLALEQTVLAIESMQSNFYYHHAQWRKTALIVEIYTTDLNVTL